jgi:hypothetical protein
MHPTYSGHFFLPQSAAGVNTLHNKHLRLLRGWAGIYEKGQRKKGEKGKESERTWTNSGKNESNIVQYGTYKGGEIKWGVGVA